MVYNNNNSTSNDNAAYIDTNVSVKETSPPVPNSPFAAEVKKVVDYFAVLNGSPEAAASFQQAFRTAFHPDVVIEASGDNDLDFTAAVECIQAFCNQGGHAELLNIVDYGDGTASMKICNTIPGAVENDVTRQIISFQDGKVIRAHAIDSDAQQFSNVVKCVKNCVPSKATPNAAEVKKLVDYFAIFDGSAESASQFQDVFHATFHPDLVVDLPGNKNLDYGATVDCIQAGLNQGSYADLIKIVDNGDGSATMTISNTLPGLTNDVTSQVAYFQDGKVIRVHAASGDEQQFGNMVSCFQRCVRSNADVASRWASMLACFNGSPGAYAKAEPIINEIFSNALVVNVGSGSPMNINEFREFAQSFAKQQNVARLEHIQSTSDGFRCVVRNIVDGADQGPVEQRGVVKDGKIVSWWADRSSADEAGLEKLWTSVAANQEGMTGNVQRMRDYLAALDGSPDAFKRFEPHIDRVLSKDIVWEDGAGTKMNYDEIIVLLRDHYIPNGCKPVLESVQVNEDDKTITVVINNHLPGEDGDATRQVLYYGDDDLIHRLVSGPFISTCQRIAALPSK